MMYPISQGYEEVNKRLDSLEKNKHYAEALLASVFVLEKTIRRSLRFCALSRGFSSKQCDKLFGHKGFNELKTYWPIFEKSERSLAEFIGNDKWQHVKPAISMRNKIVHGARVFNLTECKDTVKVVREATNILRNQSINQSIKMRSLVEATWEKIFFSEMDGNQAIAKNLKSCAIIQF